MNSLRRRVGDRLLDGGARLALDSQEMWRKSQRNGTRPTSGDLQALFVMNVLSTTAIRLGRMIMPARVPDHLTP